MDKIDVLVFFHILGAFLIAGGAGVAMASGIAMGQTASVRAIGLLSLTSHRATLLAALPGSLLVVATGTWLIADYPFFNLDELWLWLSYVLVGVAMALDHGLMGPYLVKIHARARELEEGGTLESEELRRAAAAPIGHVIGLVLLAILIAFVYLMVGRPGN